MTHHEYKAVITGIGVISPFGSGVENFWSNLLRTQSDRQVSSELDDAQIPHQPNMIPNAAQPANYLSRREVRAVPRATGLAMQAFQMALLDSGLNDFDIQNSDVILETAMEPVASKLATDLTQAPDRSHFSTIDPLLLQKAFLHDASSAVAARAKASGYVTTLTNSLSSGLQSLGMARDRIKAGCSRIVIAGVSQALQEKSQNMPARSSKLQTPAISDSAVKGSPGGKYQQVCSLGEGSVIFIIEEAAYAQARGANIYCELDAYTQAEHSDPEIRLNSAIQISRFHLLRKWLRVDLNSILKEGANTQLATGAFHLLAVIKSIQSGKFLASKGHASSSLLGKLFGRPGSIKQNLVRAVATSHGICGKKSVLTLKRYLA